MSYIKVHRYISNLLYMSIILCVLVCFSADECEYELEHTFLFSNMFPRGISSAVYSEKHALLIVTGLPNPSTEELNTQAGLDGVTMWRVLSGIPYYKLVTDYDDVSSVCFCC